MIRPAKLPALSPVATGNNALDALLRQMIERMEVREGARGDPQEKVVTHREMKALGLDASSMGSFGMSRQSIGGGVMVQTPDGTFTRVPYDTFADELRKTSLYRDLMASIDSVNRFDDIPAEVRSILLRSIADEAAERGADIRRLESKMQSANESLAYTVQEVTASVAGAAAGIREVSFASANANAATAGKVTQVQARLDDVGGVTIEESMTATADRVDGLAGEYMVKISAGGAVAGFGLAASEDPTGETESSFIVQADKFAVMMPGLANGIPFGVDASGVYINGSLRVNAGGATLADSIGKYTDYIFRRSATAPATPTGGVPGDPWFDTPPVGTDPLYMAVADKTAGGVLIGAWSTPVRLDGAEGVGVSGQYTESQYAVNSSATTAPTSGFSSTQAALSSGQFMWMQIRTVVPPASPGPWGAAVRISGEAGSAGNPGAGISSVTNYYLASASASGVTASSSGWTTAVQSTTASLKYLWNYEVIGYTTGSVTSSSPAVIGTFSVNGANGKGISSIVEYYALSTLGTSVTGSWSTTPQVTTATNKYLWNYEVITYTDSTSTTTAQRVIGAHGDTGAPGPSSPGTPGPRGSLTLFGTQYGISTGDWSDGLANATVYNAVYGTTFTTSIGGTFYQRIGDQVTLSNGSSFAQMRYWGGSSWLLPGVVIDGNLLASGVITAGISLSTSGYVKAEGAVQAPNFQAGETACGVFNSSRGSTYGVIGFSKSNGGAGVTGATDVSGGIGVYAYAPTGGKALDVQGSASITGTLSVGGGIGGTINAATLDGFDNTDFARYISVAPGNPGTAFTHVVTLRAGTTGTQFRIPCFIP